MVYHQEYLNKSNIFPGQLKFHEDGYEWDRIFNRKLTPYQYQVFLNKVLGVQRGSQNNVLSKASHVRRLFQKTSAGSPV